MINLDKLNKDFDINNIDLNQVVKILTKNQMYVVIAFAVGSLVMAFGMFKDHHNMEQGIRNKLTQEQAKLDVAKTRDAAIKALSGFKSISSKSLTVFDLIPLIKNYARSYKTDVYYSPSSFTNTALYDTLDMNFQAVSDNFKDMMLFLRAIEKSSSPIMIDSWSGGEGEDGKISFTIRISAMHIHS